MTWFINDPKVLTVLETIVNLAGPNYALPYDSSAQPANGSNMLADDLLQFNMPGGTKVQGIADPAAVTSMGKAISGLMVVIAPFLSAYELILPILGVIRGIIEIICAMMNPFSVIAAVIRLFSKWIPAFISLFPPFAGIIIILSIIKVILSIILFIMTVIVPMFQLIKHDIQSLALAFGADGNEQQKSAEREKLLALIIELLNQTGLLNVIKPILDIVLAILSLAGGYPCGGGGGKGPPVGSIVAGINLGNGYDLTGIVTGPHPGSDTTCCTDNVCPPIFRNPPQGQAIILPRTYHTWKNDAFPFFSWNIITLTGNKDLPSIAPYVQSLQQQLGSQVAEPVSESNIAGDPINLATFNIQLTNRRGQQTALIPIIQINGNNILVIEPGLITMMGAVSYKIVPNWDILVAKSIVGLACHPAVAAARNALTAQFADIETPAIVKIPELAHVGPDFTDFVSNLNKTLADTNTAVSDIIASDPIPRPPEAPITEPEFTYDTTPIDNLQNDAINFIDNYINNLRSIMSTIISKIANPVNSLFDVDKTLVAAGIADKAVVSVTIKDATGSLLAKQLPGGVNIDVKIFTTFGTISNQKLDTSTGLVTADLTSLFPGTAILTAKINGQYITEFIDSTTTATEELTVKFISDAVLPKRRLVSKQNASDIAHSTTGNIEKIPGGK